MTNDIKVQVVFKLFWGLQEGWCNSKGTLEEVKAKIQMRQEGAFKRERALVYSLVHKVITGE